MLSTAWAFTWLTKFESNFDPLTKKSLTHVLIIHYVQQCFSKVLVIHFDQQSLNQILIIYSDKQSLSSFDDSLWLTKFEVLSIHFE